MSDTSVVTRFAPSPSGELHLGNARTALFSLLAAQAHAGRFLLRIEDSDAQRSEQRYVAALLEDLRWLGIHWHGEPLHQSARGEFYAAQLARLGELQQVYPCFCTPHELELARAAQLAAGRPPRYAGTCRELGGAERAARLASGAPAALRFRVPAGVRLEFDDLVHGPQAFASDELGDFVVRRSDGTPAFFFCNAVDDSDCGVTLVLRGEDHLSNTPRQLLLLQALGATVPRYGHLSLVTGADGAPLSKRHGATSVRELRERGYLPEAVLNHLFRLGHSTPLQGLLPVPQMAAAFEPRHLQRSPAHFDPQQLHGWQKAAVHAQSIDQACAWLAGELPPQLERGSAAAFVRAVLPNVVLPEEARLWVSVTFGPPPMPGPEAGQAIERAGRAFFAAASATAAEHGSDFARIAAAARGASGHSGAALFQPLRAALTGQLHGPDLKALLLAMPAGAARERLQRFA